jgi:hypothetical protein
MKLSEVYEKLGLFYLGREKDIQSGEDSENLLLVKNKNLTTHAAIIGMTGSGKTGLGVGIIEEAVLDKIPSIVIDPKGDMGDLLLAFPDFDPKKFEPWIDKAEAERKGMDIPTYAQKIAKTWEEGIESWGQDRERVKRYKEGADFTIYTPGSSAGIPLSVLSSFDAPSPDILDDPDTFAYMLGSTVSSILALVGEDADPLTSKPYLLLTTIFKYFWKKGQSLTLEALIGHVTNPPFEKVGVLPLKSFYPQNERLKLAMLLNNVLASPTFAAWIEGEPLDIEKLLYTPDAKPRVAILSIAHLNDNERMFFVTLLLNKYISWMRTLSGTGSLRTLLYMDEIFGFFPATSNPPSKEPMLLLLKQARAYGIGVVLSTQNPVDLDYKGLSNIGSWFIGRLQTKQDIDRVIDGLIKSGSEALDKKRITGLLSNMPKRTFLLKSAHRDNIALFGTRWVLSYLAGPLSKPQIKRLMEEKKALLKHEQSATQPQPLMQRPAAKKQSKVATPPPLSEEIDQFYLNTFTQECSYRPYLLANATIHFYNAKRAIDEEESHYLKYPLDPRMKDISWEEGMENEDDFDLYDIAPIEGCGYERVPEFITELKNCKPLEKSFANYLYRSQKITLYRVPKLKLESTPEEDEAQFRVRVADYLRDEKEEAIERLKSKYAKKRESLERKLSRALEKLDKEEADVSASTTNTVLSVGMTILDAFLGRSAIKRSTTSKAGSALRNAGRMYREKDDVERARARVEEIEEEIEALEEALQEEIEEISEMYEIENYEIEPFYIKPRRSDIHDIEIALLWESEQA